MTRRQFYTAFADALAHTPDAVCTTTEPVRIWVPSLPPDRALFCPITFVAYATTQEYYRLGEWCEAALRIGLHPRDADAMSAGADALHAEPQTRQALLRRIDASEEHRHG